MKSEGERRLRQSHVHEAFAFFKRATCAIVGDAFFNGMPMATQTKKVGFQDSCNIYMEMDPVARNILASLLVGIGECLLRLDAPLEVSTSDNISRFE